jgi:protein O-mannosyl-transferase
MCATFLSELASFVSAMLFAVHPIHTEAVSFAFSGDHEKCTNVLCLCAKVTGVVGRAETLSSVFFIAAFMFYSQATRHRKQTSWRMMTLAVLSVATAMLCKEQGITILGVCFAYELFVTQKVSAVWMKDGECN